MAVFESISIELTKRCNLSCVFCYAKASTRSQIDELATGQVISFLEHFRKQGGRRVLFTGGEVFVRSDLFDIIGHATSLGLIVDIFSNGTLINKEKAAFLAKYVNLTSISLDGPSSVHDAIRELPGSFARSSQSVRWLHEADARFAIQCMMIPQNIGDVSWLIKLAQETQPMMIKLAHVSRLGRGRDREEMLFSLAELSSIRKLASSLSEECNHFHTRVLTNVITAQDFKVFYPSFDKTLQPWMLPDGRLLLCYVDRFLSYWTFSTAAMYPNMIEEVIAHRQRLVHLAYERAATLPYFDFLELMSDVADEIAAGEEIQYVDTLPGA